MCIKGTHVHVSLKIGMGCMSKGILELILKTIHERTVPVLGPQKVLGNGSMRVRVGI